MRVHALSHSAQFGEQMNLIRAIGEAMDECADQRSVLVWPDSDGRSHDVLHAHEHLARTYGDGAICTVPFVGADERAFGALMLERSPPEPFDKSTVLLVDGVAALVGPALEDKRRNDELLITKIGGSLWTQIVRLVGPRHTARKLVVALVVALLAWLGFARGQYRISARTTLEGAVQRVVAVPFRGFIHEAPVRSGEIVREGQVLARLDVRDLDLEYARWSSEREQYLLEHRRAMAQAERATMAVLEKRMRQAEAQLGLLSERISRATITAPFDGLVVSGDLTQSLGAPVEVGQVLFEVAPLDAYRVKLHVDEREIADVRAGQSGQLILTAMPQEPLPFTVAQVTPVAVSDEGRNFFVVEGRLDRVSDRLRPGMEGFGKIDVERRRLIWILTHRLVDWVRLKAWEYLP
jgi:RND family efflux transporter MFP subunit